MTNYTGWMGATIKAPLPPKSRLSVAITRGKLELLVEETGRSLTRALEEFKRYKTPGTRAALVNAQISHRRANINYLRERIEGTGDVQHRFNLQGRLTLLLQEEEGEL